MNEPFRITGRVLPLALPIFLCGFAALIVALCGIHDREGWAIGSVFGALAALGIDWRPVDARLVIRLKRAARQPGNIEIALDVGAPHHKVLEEALRRWTAAGGDGTVLESPFRGKLRSA